MAVLHIDVRDLSAGFDDALAHAHAGEEVLIKRDGEIVARIVPCATPVEEKKGDLRIFLEERLADPPLDEDFECDVARAREWLNGVRGPASWE